MKISIVLAAGCAAAVFIVSAPALADQTGLAGMHPHYTVKGRQCFTEHTHVGNGRPMRSKKQAVMTAAEDWSSFTAFEYGSSWASWSVAIAKAVKCEQSGANWLCEVQARPCLNGPERRTQQARR